MMDRRLLRPLREHRGPLLLALGLTLAGAGATFAWAWSLARAVDGAFLGGWGVGSAAPWLVAFAVAGAVRFGLRYGVDLVGEGVARQVRAGFRMRVLDHVERLGPAWVAGQRSGEVTAALTEGIDALHAWYARFFPQLLQAVLIPPLLVLAVAPLDVVSGAILALTAPLIPVFMILIGDHAKQQVERQYTQLARMSAHFLEVLRGLPTLRALGAARAELARVERVSTEYGSANLRVLRVAFVSALALELISTLSVALVAVGIGLRLLSGDLTFSVGLFILVLAPEVYQPLRALGAAFHASMAGVEAARQLGAILEQPAPETGDTSVSEPLVGLTLESVRHVWPGSERPALDGVSLELPAGRTLALVGASGAGKSTVAQLVLGLVRPTGGFVRVDGVDLADVPPRDWRRHLAWVPQHPHLFAGTLGDNVRLGAPDAPAEAVREAVSAAGLTEVVERLGGLDAPVGEGGARLSGGEAQRVALARALLVDASVVVLDEFTASLDADTEARVRVAVDALCRDRTVLLVAHRLSTVFDADEIAVLDAGRVVERGTHAELVAAGGAYSRLVEALA